MTPRPPAMERPPARGDARPALDDARPADGDARPPAMTVVRHLDLVLLALALPLFLLAGLPMLGYAAGALAWLTQRAIQVLLNRRAAASDDPRTVVGLTAGSMIGRGWLVAGIIFAAGLSDEDAGLAAAVLVIVLFTGYFTVNMILRPFEQAPRRPS